MSLLILLIISLDMQIAYLIKQKLEALEKFITKIFDVEKYTYNLINLLIQIEVVSMSQVILRLLC